MTREEFLKELLGKLTEKFAGYQICSNMIVASVKITQNSVVPTLTDITFWSDVGRPCYNRSIHCEQQYIALLFYDPDKEDRIVLKTSIFICKKHKLSCKTNENCVIITGI